MRTPRTCSLRVKMSAEGLWLAVAAWCVLSVNSCSDGSKLQIRNNISAHTFKPEYTSDMTLAGIKVTVLPWLLVYNPGCLRSVELLVNMDGNFLVNLSKSSQDGIKLTEDAVEWTINNTAPCQKYTFQLQLFGKTGEDKHQVDQINNTKLVFGPATPSDRYHPWSQLSSMEVTDKVEFKYPGNLSWKPAKCAKQYKVIVMPEHAEENGNEINWELQDAIEKLVTSEKGLENHYVQFKELKPCQYYIANISVTDQYNNTKNMELYDDEFYFYSGPNKTELSLVEVDVSIEENDATATWKASDSAICDQTKKFKLIWEICHGDFNSNCSSKKTIEKEQRFIYSHNFSDLQNCTNYTLQVFLVMENNISLEVGQKGNFFVENCQVTENDLSDRHGMDEETHNISGDMESKANITGVDSHMDEVSEAPENVVGSTKSFVANSFKNKSEAIEESSSVGISESPENLTQEYQNDATKSSQAEEPDNLVVTGLWIVVGVALLVMVAAIISVAFDITPSTIRKGAWTLCCSQRGIFKMNAR